MSNLAKLLKSRGLMDGAANLAKAANPTPSTGQANAGISQISQISRGAESETHFFHELEGRLRQMAVRWEYMPEELAEAIELARLDPVKWHLAVDLDERLCNTPDRGSEQ
jgi:hypothetical protein